MIGDATEYESIATGRTGSMFAADVARHDPALRDALGGRRVLVVGAAGSIGSSVLRVLLRYRPAAVALADVSENNLVEVVRDLRSTDGLVVPDDFLALPIAMGSVEFRRFLADAPAFDYVLNLAAIKHVRSEKDVYSLARMVDTNVLFPRALVRSELRPPCRKFFSVSSDKATNPAGLMGASKMVMEQALLAESDRQPFSTARFANVAFSDGSLPHGLVRRIQRRQPLSAPRDVRRFFMSHEEAGEICVLACALGGNREVYFPNLQAGADERTFADIARDLLARVGYEPVECGTEDEARRRAAELIPARRWPCHFFASDTSGEKAFEEFHAAGEDVDLARYAGVGVVRHPPATAAVRATAEAFVAFAEQAKADPGVTKGDYVRAFAAAVPGLRHAETGRSLDQKM